MNLNIRFRYCALVAAILALNLTHVAVAKSLTLLPDFFVFIADDLGVLDTEPYGSPDAVTPNVSRLAREGLQFTRAFINSPSCAPSRAALFTALRSQRNGIEANHDYKHFAGVTHALDGLKALNYEIAAFGKITHGDPDRGGWDHGLDRFGGRDFNAEEIETFLKNRDKSRPLLLMIGSKQPHVPWPPAKAATADPKQVSLPPRSFDTLQTRIDFTRYLEDVKTMDRKLGIARKLVDQYLNPENVITLFTSDHGAQWPFAKWNLYDSGTRVPIIMTWPNRIKPKTKTTAMVSWIDIFPTFTDIVGQQQDLKRDGRSFKEVLFNPTQKHRDKIFTTHTAGGANQFPMRAVRTEQWKYIRNLYPEFYFRTAIDAGKRKNSTYLETWEAAAAKNIVEAQIAVNAYRSRPAEELYNVEADPHETKNLVGNPLYSNVLNELRAEVLRLMRETNDQKLVERQPKYHFDISGK